MLQSRFRGFPTVFGRQSHAVALANHAETLHHGAVRDRFPHLQAKWCPVTVVVVVGYPPEIGTDAEPAVEILGTVHFVGGDRSERRIECEIDRGRADTDAVVPFGYLHPG